MTPDPADFRPDRLKRDFRCIYLDNADPGEKLSGGFYDQTYIQQGNFEKYDAYFAVTWILEGSGTLLDYLGRQFPLEPGAMLIRHAGTTYHLFSRRSEADHWLEFSAALPRSLYQALTAVGILDSAVTILHPGLSGALLEKAHRYVEALAWADHPEERARAYSCFLDFFGLAHDLSARKGKRCGADEELLLDRACERLGEGFDETLSIRRLARQLHMGYESFRKKFFRRTGVSPHEYRIRKRLEKADSLLLQTRMPIKEIAAQLGYSEVAAFSRQYQSRRGQSPRTVRIVR